MVYTPIYKGSDTAQKMKFSIKDFFSNLRKLRIWSHLLRKSLLENFIFCAVWDIKRFYGMFDFVT